MDGENVRTSVLSLQCSEGEIMVSSLDSLISKLVCMHRNMVMNLFYSSVCMHVYTDACAVMQSQYAHTYVPLEATTCLGPANSMHSDSSAMHGPLMMYAHSLLNPPNTANLSSPTVTAMCVASRSLWCFFSSHEHCKARRA